MLRLRYWGGHGWDHWKWLRRNRTITGWALHFGPLTLVINTDRLP